MGIFEKEIWQLKWNKLVTLYQQHDSFSQQKFNQSIFEKKIKEEKMEESFGLGKKSYGTETDTETWSWFRLPIPKPGFGRTLLSCRGKQPLHEGEQEPQLFFGANKRIPWYHN